jgi:quercetin dioxygenase-like cupin family protein
MSVSLSFIPKKSRKELKCFENICDLNNKEKVSIVKHVHHTEVKLEDPNEKGAKDVMIRWLITKKDGAENFAMRLFEIKPNGYTTLHQHDWEHEVFILEGNGVTKDKTKETPFEQGDVLFVPPMEWHQFVNTGKDTLKFICVIPYKE